MYEFKLRHCVWKFELIVFNKIKAYITFFVLSSKHQKRINVHSKKSVFEKAPDGI